MTSDLVIRTALIVFTIDFIYQEDGTDYILKGINLSGAGLR